MASSKKTLQKINDSDVKEVNIASLADRPTGSSRYGVGDLSAQDLKRRFDAFPALVAKKMNAIVDALSSSEASKYIVLNGSVGGIDNLYDFLALFCEKIEGKENISDYIDALYMRVTESAPTSRSLQSIIDDMSARIIDVAYAQSGYDLVIRSDDEFDQCLYALFKNEENLSKSDAVSKVIIDSEIGKPNLNFTARRVLVKNVTFEKTRGYDDVRLHVFQPSIEYIKFENCRWETRWIVSGKNPRDPSVTNYNLNSTYTPEEGTGKPRATAFNRATNALHLTVEGIHVTEGNVAAAPVPDGIIGWGIGLRNIKVLRDCNIEYPADYRIPAIGHNTFEISCQFFDFTDTCNVSSLWDGTNVSNCRVNKILKRCANVSNVDAVNLLDQRGASVPVLVDNCTNLVNLRGQMSFDSCTSISATREDAQSYANTAESNAKAYAKEQADTKVPILTPSAFTEGVMLYGRDPSGNTVLKHARSGAYTNEIAIRDSNGKLGNSWQDNLADYGASYSTKWGKGICMPRHYIDEKFNLYDERVAKIENYLGGDNFVVDGYIAYQKIVPKNACEKAKVLSVGGMSYKINKLDDNVYVLREAKVSELNIESVNLWNEVWYNARMDEHTGVFDEAEGYSVVSSKDYISVIPGESIYTSVECWVAFYDKSKNFITSGSKHNAGVFSTPSNCYFIKFQTLGYGTFYKNDIIMARSTKKVPYVPYVALHSFSIPYNVQELDGYGWGVNADCYNYIDFVKKQFVKRVGKLVLDGVSSGQMIQSVYPHSSGMYYWVLYLHTEGTKTNPLSCICSHFETYKAEGDTRRRGTCYLDTANDSSVIVIYPFYQTLDNVERANSYLAEQFKNGTPITFYYELAAPVVTDISDILTDDCIIDVEAGGTITAVNEHNLPAPTSIKYLVTYPKEV